MQCGLLPLLQPMLSQLSFIAQGYLPRDSFVQRVEPSHIDHQSRQSLTDLATQASLIGTVSQLKFSFPGDSRLCQGDNNTFLNMERTCPNKMSKCCLFGFPLRYPPECLCRTVNSALSYSMMLLSPPKAAYSKFTEPQNIFPYPKHSSKIKTTEDMCVTSWLPVTLKHP